MLRVFVTCLFFVSISHQSDGDKRIPPYFLRKPKTTTYIGTANEKRTLECRVGGIPEPAVTWQKDGQPIETSDEHFKLNEEDGSLTVEAISSYTEGSFSCRAENDFGVTVSEERILKTAYMKSPLVATQHVSVLEGKMINLVYTKIDSVPEASVGWYKLPDQTPEKDQMALNERTYIDSQGRLWIGYAMKEDTSTRELYKGRCKNLRLDQSASCSVYNITVSDAPSGRPEIIEPSLIYSTPNKYLALENQTMILECLIPSRPFENVKWSRENNKPRSALSELDDFGYRLTVKKVRPEDAGEYVCQSGKVTHAIKVTVEAAPVFHDTPRDTNVTEGSDVVINCSSHAIPSASVEWFINSKPIKRNEAIPRISISDDSQTLLIRRVCRDCTDGRHTDSMVVQCMASNTHGRVFSSTYVNVLKRTEAKLVTGESEYVKETGYEPGVVVLNCSASSDPLTPVSPKWYSIMKRNHKELLVSDSENMIVKGGLLIFNLSDTSSKSWKRYHGDYACIADNGYSDSVVRSKITVKGISPVVASIINFWWILVLAAILLVVIVIATLVQCLYNVGDSYNVNKNELKNGNNPIREIEEKDFKIYSRPEPVDFRGSQATLISKSSRELSENEMEGYHGRFGDINEDGSFLGVYMGDRQRSFSELA